MQPPIDGGLDLMVQCDIVVVPGWKDEQTQPVPELLTALQTAYQRGAYIVGLCYGAYALAYAGLLDGKKAATHWKGEADFSRRFPKVKLDVNSIYVEDGNIMTSAGTAAALDCCLHIIRKFYGAKAANKTARLLAVPPHREGGQAQFIERPLAQSTKDTQINALLDYLRDHLHEPQNIDEVAERVSMSRSTFTRHFKKATGMTFLEWLHKERLQRSLDLLENSGLSVEQIAEKTGFQNTVSFRQQFFKYYQVNPHVWRKMFRDDG
ncbi:GlxA family transcriptional regulator [Neisseria weixii]|nr:helix-turn-helix domain-containing protein [Neisseria weixii]